MRQGPTGAAKKSSRKGIFIVDDHPLIRERLAEIINHQSDLVACGEAEDKNEALAGIRAKLPDLVIVDLKLKSSDGLDLIKEIHSRWPELPVLVLSMHDDALYAERAIRAGARGYLNKQAATQNLLPAIRRVLSGALSLDDKITTRIVARLTAKPGETRAGVEDLLSERELRVFELTGDGLTPHQIAARLNIGVKTVETYRGRIRTKLGLGDGSELLRLAIAWTHEAGHANLPLRHTPPGSAGWRNARA
jgi:DNA-binding NarL/FixJ family response regulator